MTASSRKPAYYILEAERPIVLFQASGFVEARELKKERWLLDDLRSQTSAGVPLWDGKCSLNVRPATAEEVAVAAPSAEEDPDELVLTYLLPLDEAR